MPDEPIHRDVVQVALDRAEGFPFERFANDFYGALAGATFAPLGGIKDGGADARAVEVGGIYEDGGRPQTSTKPASRRTSRARSARPSSGCANSVGTRRC
jgi:hypothetical protein